MRAFIYYILFTIVFIFCFSGQISSQTSKYGLGMDYTTEIQNNFGKKINWVNLLSLYGDYTPWRNGNLSIQTITVFKTRKNRIADDLQTFSNIEADNMAVNIFMGGYTQKIPIGDLFFGLRNMNNDYFIGDYTALFSNSSSGIYPTISSNFPAPNYPLSAMCFHADLKICKIITVKNSFYNGFAGKMISKHGSNFNINPKHDGIFNVTEISLSPRSELYALYGIGAVIHNKFTNYEDSYSKSRKKSNYAIWGNIEQEVFRSGKKAVGILLQGSFAPSERNNCSHYYGGGIIMRGFLKLEKSDTFGIFINKAAFRGVNEIAMEFTWIYKLCDILQIEPTIHYIRTGRKTNAIGLIRLKLSLNKSSE